MLTGQMMDWPLLVSAILEHGAGTFGDRPITTRSVEGPVVSQTIARTAVRARRLANVLRVLGVERADRVATLAWNTHRHVELYYAISGTGAVCHTVNPRLHPSQFAYILNHAEDGVLFTDLTFLKLIAAVAPQLEHLRHVVVLTDPAHMPDPSELGELRAQVHCYEALLAAESDRYVWPDLDERAACALCYTSGTTGHPKGVLYSHRSTVLHAMGFSLPGAVPLAESDVILPVVPQFHVLAWGVPYAAVMNGAGMALPGPGLDGASLTALMNQTGTSIAAGVPTVWHGLMAHWQQTGERVPSLERIVIGGSAAPRAMLQGFEETYGIRAIHAWGMTETSPLGTVSTLKSSLAGVDAETRYAKLQKQGRPVFGVELRLAGGDGAALPHDGKAVGELMVRGPWIAAGYFKQPGSPLQDGWFPTGDVAHIDPDRYMAIVDRTKDLIKSGGEWISSIDVENLAMAHPQVAMAAVIGVPDDKWGERPVLYVVPSVERDADPDTLRAFLAENLARWQVPDRIVLVDALPLGATGKVKKSALREQWAAGHHATG